MFRLVINDRNGGELWSREYASWCSDTITGDMSEYIWVGAALSADVFEVGGDFSYHFDFEQKRRELFNNGYAVPV